MRRKVKGPGQNGALFMDRRMLYGWLHQAYLQVTWVSKLRFSNLRPPAQ